MKGFRYLRNGESLSVCDSTCVGCGACVDVCPHAVFEIRSGKALILDRSLCMECGACARNCPVGAISVNAGVGCAAAIIAGTFRGGAPACDCGAKDSCC
jgi:NAD-dependent dihydropyrimidine dehydrogenase PreA subunit